MTKIQVLEIRKEKDQTKEQALAEYKSKSKFLSTAVIESFGVGLGDDFSFQSTMQTLEKTIQQIQSGDLSKIEEMYISQAVALEGMFTSLARRAKNQEKLLQYETHMRFALKAQNQCRATLQALVQLKQPSNTTFVKQANIAQGHQQVNNGIQLENKSNSQNKLLEDINDLDTRTKAATKPVDSQLDALELLDRGENS